MNAFGAAAAVVLATAWWYGWAWPLLYVATACMGAYYTVQWRLVHGDFYRPPTPQQQVTVASVLLQKMMVSILHQCAGVSCN